MANEIKSLKEGDLLVTGHLSTLRFRRTDDEENGDTIRIWENDRYAGTNTDAGAQAIVDKRRARDGNDFAARIV